MEILKKYVLNTMKIPILSLNSEKFAEAIFQRLGKGKELSKYLYKSWIRNNKIPSDLSAFPNSEKILQEILEITDFDYTNVHSSFEENGTRKALLRTVDGHLIEMVVIPMKRGKTLCISSQVGCKMGCLFCKTAKMGLVRSLNAQEIVSQVFLAQHHFKEKISNIVFMGMGEPFDNYENVMQAIDVLMDVHGLGFGPSRITVSTSGLVDKINLFAVDAHPALNLAISLSGGSDLVREKLMPVNRKFNMQELKEAMKSYAIDRKVFIEYVMIAGKNDTQEEAENLANYLAGIDVTINLIPYNPIGILSLNPSSSIEEFANHLKSKGYPVYIRSTHGQKIMAACGQLGNRRNRTI